MNPNIQGDFQICISVPLRKSQKLLRKNEFLVSAIFFTVINSSFFSLRFYLFLIITKEVNQIRNTIVCDVARLVFLFCCTLTTARCNAFQTPQNHPLNVCLMKILKSIVTKKSVVCFYNSCQENFKSSGLSNISNLNNGCV